MEVRGLTVGMLQENCYVARAEGSDTVVVVDPGEEGPRILQTVADMGARVEAILLTHCHFDHVGAVAELARATQAPVTCPELETAMLEDINSFTFPGFGPYEGYTADKTVKGGETLQLAGLQLDVLFTPGHSPGHVTYAASGGLFSGDVLFQQSVGRTDLPGGDWPTLARSIATLLERFPDETTVFPGHMGATTLGQERATNPFLAELV
ncbi:MAG TPA: MBL fold metallo-hydrolase [Solirubrobacteraceae bacterium]|nr:MBL fold metallo-hydrolase [Solirubrobacteraceae bacterium]